MNAALKTLEKIKESLETLNTTIRGFMEKAKEETAAEVAVVEPEAVQVAAEAPAAVAAVETNGQAKRKGWKGGVNRSDLVRDYFRKHGMDVRNKDLIDSLQKTHKVKIEPSLVSAIRRSISEGKKPKKKITKKAVEAKKKKVRIQKDEGLSRLPMPALCATVLKKFGSEDGLKLKEITDMVIDAGYDYKGKKGPLGVAQNVYQALHGLAQKKSHPGYNGKVAVILHDETSKRWRLNPKATRKIA